jgi:beta-N-acetylhexosaminidase
MDTVPPAPPAPAPAAPSPDTPRRRSIRRSVRWHRRTPAWLVRTILLALLVAATVRAGLASATFMAPGGDILGWTRIPQTQCALCHAPTPTADTIPGVATPAPLTPDEYAAELVQYLTLDEELEQMQMVAFDGTSPTPDLIRMVGEQYAGGVLFFGYNIETRDQVRALNAAIQKVAPIPLVISVDQEGGSVNRFWGIVGPLPSASDLPDPAAAYARGQQDAGYLHDMGFNLNLAPVVDVGMENPQIGGRSFSSDPGRVATMAGAYMDGLQASGTVSACLKHYPGLGATDVDPHYGMPILGRSRADWEQIDLEPYRRMLADNDVRAIMVTHEMIPAVDTQLPSSLSPATLDGVLRQELGYDGVVITDSLYMGALNQRWSIDQAIVLAVKAGADMLFGPVGGPYHMQLTIGILKQAIANGQITRERIDTSARRILAMKIRMGLIPLPQPSIPATPTPTPVPATATATPEGALPRQPRALHG